MDDVCAQHIVGDMSIKEKKRNRVKKKLGNYPFVNVIFSISSALFMIGLFGAMAFYANRLTNKIGDNIEMQVYLKRDLIEPEIDRIQLALEEKEFIDTDVSGNPRVSYLSKEEAAQQMIEETGENFVEFLGENPLRNAFIIHVKEQYRSKDQMQAVRDDLEGMVGVFEVVYTERMVDEINANIKRIGSIVGLFVVILLFTVYILINNAIRLALFSQRFLIRSMQLVGATPFFIKKPFLLSALAHGTVSGFLASLFLIVLLIATHSIIPDLNALFYFWELLGLSFLLIVLGAGISVLSALTAINKYLNMELDELY